MAVDVIVTWAPDCDFPLWRRFIADERERFGEVFVVFSERHLQPDLRSFLRSNFYATFIESPDPAGRDWRDVAVNAALDRSTADRVWFTEQDFLVTDPDVFWPQTEAPAAGVFVNDGRLMHPACIFADRALVEKTSRYFGPTPVDHFYTFGNELAGHAPLTIIEGGWRHYQATSESQMMIALGQDPKFRPAQFREWISENLVAGVPLDPRWEATARASLL